MTRPDQPVVEVGRLEGEQVDPGGDVENAVERPSAHEFCEHSILLGQYRLREAQQHADADEGGELGDDRSDVVGLASDEHGVEEPLDDEELDDEPDCDRQLQRGCEQQLLSSGLRDETERVGDHSRKFTQVPLGLRMHDVPPRSVWSRGSRQSLYVVGLSALIGRVAHAGICSSVRVIRFAPAALPSPS